MTKTSVLSDKNILLKVSLNDLIIKAAATTLQLVPEVNINVVGEAEYIILPNVDISVAVATPNGLITPIVTNAIGKTLPEISSSVRDLALRARDGKLQLNEFQVNKFCSFDCSQSIVSQTYYLLKVSKFQKQIWYPKLLPKTN